MLTESSDEDVPGAPIANMTPQPGPSVRLDSTSSSLAQCFISLDNHNEMLLASYRNANHDEDFQKIVDPVMATVAYVRLPSLDSPSSQLIVRSDTCPMAVDLLTGATSGIADQSVGPIITAIMIKVFDMCELVVTLASRKAASFVGSPRAFDQTVRPALPRRTSSSQWSRETNAQSMVKFVLTLKQVDIHLTQAKLCLSLLGHEKATHPDYAELTPAERSDGLHERISSIIDEICD